MKAQRAGHTADSSPVDMLQSLPQAVVSFDAAGDVVFANHAARALFGAGALNVFRLAGNGPVADAARHVVRTGGPVTLHDVPFLDTQAQGVSIAPQAADGLYVMSVHLSPLPLAADWTRKARHALKPAQAMARTLAHEIRNPLAGIHGAAQLLGRGVLRDDDRELVQLITREAERILRLVRKVDVFADSAPQNFTAVNVHEVLGQVVQVARAGFHAAIAEDYDPSLPPVRGDFDLLVQAVMNLVKNAAEAMPANGGTVTLRTFYDNAAPRHPDTGVKLPLCVAVEDNGAGIAPETLRRIFDPWFTTKPEGEGLGLAIVAKIVDDHGGAIDVDSRAGRSVFRVRFPAGGAA